MQPVFIGGCDRSGTTMLGAMLGAHSACLCVPEAQFVIDLLGLSPLTGWQPGDLDGALQLVLGNPRFRLWDIELDITATRRQQIDSCAQLIQWIVVQYGVIHAKPVPDYWVDHTPWNTHYAASLFDLFPQAKLVHIIRDGRAVASSIMPLRWGPKTIDQAAYFWLRNLSYGLAAESKYREHVLRVRYEELVGQPQESLHKLCAFIGLQYQPDMLKADGFSPPAFTAGQHALVGQPLDPGRIDAWQSRLTTRQVEIFENITGDMLRYLGYQPVGDGKKRAMTFSEKVSSRLGMLRMFAGNLRQQRILQRYAGKNHLQTKKDA